MRLETTAGQLRAALRSMTGIVSRRNTIPVLGCVKIDGGRLVGTDIDSEVSVALPTLGKADGAAVVDFFALSALAAHVDAGEALAIADDDGVASVAFNGSDYRMASLPVSDFPDFERPGGTRTMAGNLGLVDAMRRVQFCVSTEETRYYLNGVALLDGPEGPLAVATNGHCLAMMPLSAMPDGAAGAIIPRRVVSWLVARKGEPEAVTFQARVDDKGDPTRPSARPCALFEMAGVTLAAKLIDGTFPDIFRVVPADAEPVFSVERLALLKALRRLDAFVTATSGRWSGVKLEGGADGLRLSVGRVDMQAGETIGWSGDAPAAPFAAGYNQRYLIDILSRLTGEVVTFCAAADMAGSPVIITSENDAMRVVLMPMRV